MKKTHFVRPKSSIEGRETRVKRHITVSSRKHDVKAKRILYIRNEEPRSMSIITSALSGMTGGGILLSFLGPAGAIAGGIVGAAITGYSEFVNQVKK